MRWILNANNQKIYYFYNKFNLKHKFRSKKNIDELKKFKVDNLFVGKKKNSSIIYIVKYNTLLLRYVKIIKYLNN